MTTDFETPFLMIEDHFAQPNATNSETKSFYNFEYLDFVIGDIKTGDFKLNGSKQFQNLSSCLFLSFLFWHILRTYCRYRGLLLHLITFNNTHAHTHTHTNKCTQTLTHPQTHRCETTCILISSLHGAERSALRAGRFNLLCQSVRYTLARMLLELQSHSGRGGEENAKRTFRLSVGVWLSGLQRNTRLWLQICRQGGKALERACFVVAVVLMISW